MTLPNAAERGDWIILAVLVVFVILVLASREPCGAKITTLYEDGSGTFTDGRSFCITGELCDDNSLHGANR